MSTPVEFWFDPACPWTWITSRWVVDVAPQRDLDITWRTFSLWRSNAWAGNEIPEQYRPRLESFFSGLRVIEAARATVGERAVGELYTEIGARIHHDGVDDLSSLPEVLDKLGLPASLAAAAADASYDATIEESTREGIALVGPEVGVPIIAVRDGSARVSFFGPVLSPAPTGAAAARLWDSFVGLGAFDGLYEIKRTRATGPQFGPRPA